MKNKLIQLVAIVAISISCNQTSTEKNNNSTNTDLAKEMAETGVDNASKAKTPKGKLSCVINGETVFADDNSVQCMFVGTGQVNYAQGMIFGKGSNFSINGVMMSKAELATLKGEKMSDPTSLMISKDGVKYASSPGGNVVITISKIKQDGNNYYIGGSFSGLLKSSDGETITVTNGLFESSYL